LNGLPEVEVDVWRSGLRVYRNLGLGALVPLRDPEDDIVDDLDIRISESGLRLVRPEGLVLDSESMTLVVHAGPEGEPTVTAFGLPEGDGRRLVVRNGAAVSSVDVLVDGVLAIDDLGNGEQGVLEVGAEPLTVAVVLPDRDDPLEAVLSLSVEDDLDGDEVIELYVVGAGSGGEIALLSDAIVYRYLGIFTYR
jgi:hypothetical protein